MNRALELQILNEFEDEHYFPPKGNWPKYEFAYRSCCRWAISEIRKSFQARPETSVIDILSDLYAHMETAMAEADETQRFNGVSVPASVIFSVGREMTEIVAGLYL